jgi:oligopeptide/dipeptide ABC transporter ATP-binding protein
MSTGLAVSGLAVSGLAVSISRGHERHLAVTDVSFSVAPGEALGIVGESGSGKSLTLRAVAGILPPGVRRDAGGPEAGPRLAMIFQEPLGAMNPTRRIGDAIADVVRSRRRCGRAQARARAVDLLREVGIPDPERRARSYPHELSGGLRQRAVIACGLATEPDVLLCDEPTTALDVTVQDQILGLLDRLRRERAMAVVFVTHDLAVVSTLCQRLAVMYAGQIVETGPTRDVLRDPRHPYTKALVTASQTRTSATGARPIGGSPPDPGSYAAGCRFADRCAFAADECRSAVYELAVSSAGRADACIRQEVLLP